MAGDAAWKIEFFVPSVAHDAFADALDPFVGALSLFPVEESGETRITGYGADAPDEAVLAAALAETAKQMDVPPPAVHVVWLPDVDWVAENQASFAPVRAGRFHIHDSDHMAPPPAGSVPVRVDAATAFGTGHHGTTRGCLEALDHAIRSGVAAAPVLDLGCGTGILAIAAAKAMRTRVIASDIDPVAVARAQELDVRWTNEPDRQWAGPDFWGNRLQDWRVHDGRLECTATAPRLRVRTLHLLTRRLGAAPEPTTHKRRVYKHQLFAGLTWIFKKKNSVPLLVPPALVNRLSPMR